MKQFTPLELEIMQVLWDRGPSSVIDVRKSLRRDLAYTTVQTMLNILVRKGKLKRTLVGRAYHYRAAVTRATVMRATLRDVVQRVFGGSAEALVMSLVETKQLTAETMRRLNEMIDDEKEQ